MAAESQWRESGDHEENGASCALDLVEQFRFHQFRQRGDGGKPEEIRRTQGHAKTGPHSRQKLDAKERIASEFEQVIVDSDLIHSQQISPDARDGLFQFAFW